MANPKARIPGNSRAATKVYEAQSQKRNAKWIQRRGCGVRSFFGRLICSDVRLDYIANEEGDWATSSAYVKKSLLECIKLGRSGLSEPGRKEDWWEALRLLGQSCHVMEDVSFDSSGKLYQA
jgi:hypothetical protein